MTCALDKGSAGTLAKNNLKKDHDIEMVMRRERVEEKERVLGKTKKSEIYEKRDEINLDIKSNEKRSVEKKSGPRA